MSRRIEAWQKALTPEECRPRISEQKRDELWLSERLHGRGLDTLPDDLKRAIQERFAKYGTAGLFPEHSPVGNPPASLSSNLTIGTA